MRTAVAGVLLVALALLTAACEGKPDDELVRPTVTVTTAPEVPVDLPRLPVGKGAVQPGDTVSADVSVLVVGTRRINLAPVHVASPVAVPGGVFFLNRGELWFTDLSRARATAFADVRDLALSPDGRRLTFVDLQHGAVGSDGSPLPLRVTYDATTGKQVGARYVE